MHVGIGGFPLSNVVVVGRRKRRKGETPIPTCTSKESPIKSKANERFGTLARSTYRRTFGGLILVYVFFLTFCGCPRGINMLGPRCEYIIIVLLLVSVTASSVSGNYL